MRSLYSRGTEVRPAAELVAVFDAAAVWPVALGDKALLRLAAVAFLVAAEVGVEVFPVDTANDVAAGDGAAAVAAGDEAGACPLRACRLAAISCRRLEGVGAAADPEGGRLCTDDAANGGGWVEDDACEG